MKPTIYDSIGNNKNIKVSILCIKYNHKPYIRRTLEQLINQKTNFDYEIIIHDDNSNDGTKEIIMEYVNKYPNKVRAIIQNENQYSQDIDFMKEYIFPLINGKYTAYCEGDDYWSTLDKLQLQFNFLENNLDYVAVGGITKNVDDLGNEIFDPKPYKKYYNKELLPNDFLCKRKANIGSNTIMHKTDILKSKNYLKARSESVKIGDLLLIINIFEHGKLFVIGKIFQIHIIQSRKESSNYNSIFSYKQKFEYSIRAGNSILNFKNEYDVKGWIREHTALFFYYCLLHNSLCDFFESRKMLNKKYRENTVVCLIRSVPSVIDYLLKK